eukprot:gene12716-13931_t
MTSREETLENSDHICVNCRYRVGPLFIEYSDRNFRLTRCPRCHKIADKYIEYELFLVLIDVILHEDAAYYHLLYNRYSHTITHRVKKWLPIAVVVISILVKLIVFRRTIYRHFSGITLLHVIGGSVADIVSYVGVLSCCWNYFTFLSSSIFSNVSTPFHYPTIPTTTSSEGSTHRKEREEEKDNEEEEREDEGQEDSDSTTHSTASPSPSPSPSPPSSSALSLLSSSFLKFYFAVLFPEIFKIAIILLYVFDTTSNLLFLLNTIIVTLQWTAVKCVTRVEMSPMKMKSDVNTVTSNSSDGLLYRRLLSSFVIAIVCRVIANRCFYSRDNILVLGGFS